MRSLVLQGGLNRICFQNWGPSNPLNRLYFCRKPLVLGDPSIFRHPFYQKQKSPRGVEFLLLLLLWWSSSVVGRRRLSSSEIPGIY